MTLNEAMQIIYNSGKIETTGDYIFSFCPIANVSISLNNHDTGSSVVIKINNVFSYCYTDWYYDRYKFNNKNDGWKTEDKAAIRLGQNAIAKTIEIAKTLSNKADE